MDLGAEVGISHGQLSKMERDAHPFTIAQAQRLADALGMNWTTLLHIDPRDPAGSMRDLLEADQVNTRAFGEYLADEAARYRAPPSDDRVAWHLQDIPPRPPGPRNGR